MLTDMHTGDGGYVKTSFRVGIPLLTLCGDADGHDCTRKVPSTTITLYGESHSYATSDVTRDAITGATRSNLLALQIKLK